MLDFILQKIPAEIPITIATNAFFADKFHEFAKKFPARKISIFVENSKNENEKRGALLAFVDAFETRKIDDDILFLAGDNFFDFDLKKFLNAFDGAPLLAAFNIFEKNLAKKFGVVLPKKNSNFVAQFCEKPENPPSTLVSTGISILPKKLLKKISQFAQKNRDDFGKIFEHFLRSKISVKFFEFRGKWFDIGSFKNFLAANSAILAGKNFLPKNLKTRNSQFLENCAIGENCEIENSNLQNCVVLQNAKIGNSNLQNCIVGKNATILNIDLQTKILRDEIFIDGGF